VGAQVRPVGAQVRPVGAQVRPVGAQGFFMIWLMINYDFLVLQKGLGPS
jgi:hypothetical protein